MEGSSQNEGKAPSQERPVTAADLRRKRRRLIAMAVAGLVVLLAVGVWKYLEMRERLLRLESRITFTKGEVTLVIPGQAGRPAVLGEVVPQGAVVSTGSNSEADVGFRGGGGIKLDATTEAGMGRLYRKESTRQIEIDVRKGRLFNKITPEGGDSRFKLTTPSGQMIVRGTEFFVEAGERSDLVATRTGQVEVSLGANLPLKVMVGAEEMVTLATGLLDSGDPAGERERKLFAQLDRIHELDEQGQIAGPVGFTNSLGMGMIPVKITGGSTDGEVVMIAAHETRSRDFAAFIADPDRGYDQVGADADAWRTHVYRGQPVGRGVGESAEESDRPAVMVTWREAKAFCDWLSKKEGRTYRLPTDHEWSSIVGIADREDSSATAQAKNLKIENVFPWDGPFSPEAISGNYSDEAARAAFGDDWDIIEGYSDGFATTAPVMQFQPNALGFFDLGGNVWEWCEDVYTGRARGMRTLRGGSWFIFHEEGAASSYRIYGAEDYRWNYVGFRVVEVIDPNID